ncbi:winged helix-turn-helix transcriptional regulator, partial [Kitasatospora albolonga]|uniref:winged helix-turn-helix transcriptional regulator n=1 Tax=Kitasatospora albolonga TaxID=68173 RepID=UPI0031E5967E
LRRLHVNGLVDRHSADGPSPRPEYRLTELGRSFLAPIEAVGGWAFERRRRGDGRPGRRSAPRAAVLTARPDRLR